MSSNVKRSCAWRLYVIIDRAAIGGRDLADVTAAVIRGGADAIQLRDKDASARQLMEEAAGLLPLTQAAAIPLIINDRADVAGAVEADGVHLGQDDLSIRAARRILGGQAMIGRSTHSVDQAFAAAAEGADYIGLGPIFPTPTKPTYRSIGTDLIRQVASQLHIPVVCIGGIEAATLSQVIEAGAQCVAVVRAVCSAADPESAARTLKQRLTQSGRPTLSPSL